MVSTTIGYRIKQQQSHQNKQRHASVDFECSEEGLSTSPGHAQSSDNSAETEYCPYVQPAVASASSSQPDTAGCAEPKTGCDAFLHRAAADLPIQRKPLLGCTSATLAVTPSTITKRRRRIAAAGKHLNCLTVSTQPLAHEAPALDRQASDAPTVCKSMPCGKGRELMKRVKVSLSTPTAPGISKPCPQSSGSFGSEHRGMPVSQRVIDACRPSLVDTGRSALPTANRTPMKPCEAVEIPRASPCRIDDSDFSDASDCEDCFSEQAHVPIALLDAFSPVRPRGQLNASEAQDFELEFGWDPVVRNAVMKNTFNGFGAIRSH